MTEQAADCREIASADDRGGRVAVSAGNGKCRSRQQKCDGKTRRCVPITHTDGRSGRVGGGCPAPAWGGGGGSAAWSAVRGCGDIFNTLYFPPKMNVSQKSCHFKLFVVGGAPFLSQFARLYNGTADVYGCDLNPSICKGYMM